MVATLKELFKAAVERPPTLGTIMAPRKGIGYPNEGLPCVVIDVVRRRIEPDEFRIFVIAIAYGDGRYQTMEFEPWELEIYEMPMQKAVLEVILVIRKMTDHSGIINGDNKLKDFISGDIECITLGEELERELNFDFPDDAMPDLEETVEQLAARIVKLWKPA